MRKILFFIVLCCCISASAQRVDKPGEAYDYFCIVFAQGEKADIIINDQKGKRLVDEKGAEIKFNYPNDILTYLSKRGWCLVDRYEYSKTYIMKKTVTSDEQALEHLNFKE